MLYTCIHHHYHHYQIFLLHQLERVTALTVCKSRFCPGRPLPSQPHATGQTFGRLKRRTRRVPLAIDATYTFWAVEIRFNIQSLRTLRISPLLTKEFKVTSVFRPLKYQLTRYTLPFRRLYVDDTTYPLVPDVGNQFPITSSQILSLLPIGPTFQKTKMKPTTEMQYLRCYIWGTFLVKRLQGDKGLCFLGLISTYQEHFGQQRIELGRSDFTPF